MMLFRNQHTAARKNVLPEASRKERRQRRRQAIKGRRCRIEPLEARLVLSHAPLATDDPEDLPAAASGPVAAAATIAVDLDVDGLLGDVVKVDILTELGASDPASGYYEFSIGPFNNGSVALDALSNTLSDDGLDFQDTGIAYYIPSITSPSQDVNTPGIGTTTALATYQVDLYTDANVFVEIAYTGNIDVTIDQGFSSFGDESVTEGNDRIDVYRQEQRLSYLGFRACPAANQVAADQCSKAPNANSNDIALVVDGDLDVETQWAFGVFNAAVSRDLDAQIDPATTDVDMIFINAEIAPRWKELSASGTNWTNDDGTDEHDWGTDWAEAAIEAAGVLNLTGTDIDINDLSYRSGGNTADHNTHEAGMDIDVRLQTAGLWYVVGTAATNLNGASSFWTAVRDADGGDAITTAPGARTGVAVGGDFVADYDTDGWRIDQTLSNIYGHRGSGDAYDVAVQNRVSPIGGESAEDRFDRGFDDLAGKRVSYDRSVTVAHVAAFGGADTPISTGRVIFNDPFATRLLNELDLPFPIAMAAGHGHHFHVDLLPPAAVSLDSVRGSIGGFGEILQGLIPGLIDESLAPSPPAGSPGSGPGAGELVGLSGIPFLDEGLEDMIDFVGVFDELAARLVEQSSVSGVEAPDLILGSDQTVIVLLDGATPFELTIAAGVYANVNAIVDELNNVSLPASALDGFVEAFNDGGLLALRTTAAGIAGTLAVTTLRVVAPNNAIAFGQLSADTTFTIDLVRDSGITTGEVNLGVAPASETDIDDASPLIIPVTNNNVDAADLVADLNQGLLLAGLFDVVALLDPSTGRIALSVTDPEITKLVIREDNAGQDISELGFVDGAATSESEEAYVESVTPPTSPLGLIGTRDVPDLKYDSIDALMDILETELAAISDTALPFDFEVDAEYDPDTDSILFNMALGKDFEKTVNLNFDEGIDLGIFGTLEVIADAEATFTASATLDLRAGIYLGELGGDFTFNSSTLLADLNAGDGVPLAVGLTATSSPTTSGPPDYRLSGNVSLDIILDGGAATSVTVLQTDTEDNFDLFALAADINSALVLAGIDDRLEASADVDLDKLTLTAIDPAVYSLELDNVSSADLGFTTGQTGDRNDLLITVDGTGYNVNLDGATTIGQVIAKIEAAAPVTVLPNSDKGLTVTANVIGEEIFILAALNGDTFSTAGIALGILGMPFDDTLVGTQLHGQTLEDRIFIVAGEAGEDNLSVDVSVVASGIFLSAALGILGLDATDTVPLSFEMSTGVRLLDPETVSADGRISIAEARDASLSEIVEFNAPTSSLAGELEVSSPLLGELNDGADTFATFTLGGDFLNPQFNASFNTDALKGLKNISVSQVLDIVGTVVNNITENGSLPWMNDPIPLVNRSLSDVVSFLDDLLDKIGDVVSAVDVDAIQDARDAMETTVGDLGLDIGARSGMFRALDLMQNVLTEAILIGETLVGASPPAPSPDASGPAAGEIIGDVERIASRMVAAFRNLKQQVEDATGALPSGTPGLSDLLAALDTVEALIPDLESLEDRLQTQVADTLTAALGVPVTFVFDFVDYDGNTAARENALVIGLNIDASDIVNESFTPDLSLPVFGPIEFELDGTLSLYAGGELNLGFGARFDDGSFEPFVIVDPPTTGLFVNSDLFETRVDLNAGFSVDALTASVRFGALDLLSGEVNLSLIRGVEDTVAVSVASAGQPGTVTLTAAPIDGEQRLVVVRVDGETDIRSEEDFEISGTTLTFGSDTTPANGTMVTVAYRTSAAGDPENVVADRATVAVEFDNAITDGNTIGAVSLTDFVSDFTSEIAISAEGVITGAIDVEFLNSTADDVVTLAVNINDPLKPQLVIDEDAITEMFENVEFDLLMIVQGIEAMMETIEVGLTSEIISTLPLVGDGLDAAGTFIGKMKTEYVTPFREFLEDVGGTLDDVAMQVQIFVFDALGPDGLDILGDRDDDGSVDLDDVEVGLTQNEFEIVLTLSGSDEMTADFSTNLDGLVFDIETSGGVRVGFDYEIDFGVGVSKTTGFYFVLNSDEDDPEFKFDLDIGLAVDNSGLEPIPSSLNISVFGLNLTATDVLQDDGSRGTGFSAMLTLNVNATSGSPPPPPSSGPMAGSISTERLSISDIGSKPFYEVFEAKLEADAVLNLMLSLNINANLPSIETELWVGWGFEVANGAGGIETTFDEPVLEFRDISLNFGDFLSRVIGPVVKQVDDFIEPIKPVVKFLLSEVPGLSQLSELAGRGPVTFLDLAFIKDPEGGQKAKKFLGVVDQIITIIDVLADFDDGDNVKLNFGTVTIGGNGVSLNDPFWNQSNLDSMLTTPAFLAPDPTGIEDQVNGGGNSKVAGAFASIDRDPDASGLGGLGISLEILKPLNIVKLLIGQTADIVFWDIPRFDVGLTLEQSFRPIPVLYPFKVTIGFDLGVFADLSVGYDTRGIQTGDFFDGFFFGDRENVATGPDIAEFGFSVGVRLRAELDLFVASAGIEGELVATILANWRDSDNDGKLYLDEIANIVRQDGIECLFDLTGEFRAIVRLVWSIFGKEDSKDIINALLFSFSNECPKYEVGHVSDGGEALPEGMTSQPGDLIVHAGSFATQRQPGITTDIAEQFTLTQTAPGVIEVDGMGLTQRYGGVQRIVVDGGIGNDVIELVNVDLAALLFGGPGNDTLTSGPGDDIIFGGAGNDVIITKEGEDDINAGSGDDTIDSGAGNDIIVAGGGIDIIDAGTGADTIDAGAGNDNVLGGDGDDTILGGAGNDTIDGGIGADTINAGAGIDIVIGGPGNDFIEGGLDADDIQGNEGDDEIYGDGGNDAILGGIGEDLIYGGPGRDNIEGDGGNDEIHGGSGIDMLFGNDGDDALYGDAGHDLLEGNDGDDFLYGGNDNDLLIGFAGIDDLFGGYGNDVILSYIVGDVADPVNVGHYIEGGPDDDYICGTTANDKIWGGTSDAGFALLPADPPGAPLAGGFSVVSCLDDSAPVFEEPPLVTISGRKFEDKNGDGVFDDDEPMLADWTIELLDNVGEVVATTTTAADGTYSFGDLDPGTYSVQEVQQDGFLQTYPASLTYDNLILDGGDEATGIDFGNLTLASVHGFKWSDDDGDGERDEDEAGIANVFIFADANGNKIWDAGEGFTLSMEDDPDTEDVDETGQYWINNLLPGTYEIIEVEPVGYTRTFPVRNVLYKNQFEQLNLDDEWSSTGKQGLLNIDRSPQNQRGFLGQESGHENEATTPERLGSETVTLELENLPDHTTIDLEFDLFIFGGWDGNHVTQGPDTWSLRADGTTLLETTFSNVAGRNQAYPDPLGGNNPARTGAVENDTLGYDANGLDLDEPGFTAADSVYRMEFSFPHVNDTLELDFEAMLQDNLGADFEHWGIDNIRVSFPIAGHTVTLTSGEVRLGLDFGNQPEGSGIHGTKYNDLNGNGVRDLGERGIGGVTVYSDTNGNGQLDEGEPSTETMGPLVGDTNDDGVVGVYDTAVVQRNFGLSRPGLTAADGDVNLDGRVGRGDVVAMLATFGTTGPVADPGTGNPGGGVGDYWLTDLLPGDHTIREIVPEGFIQTQPVTQVVFSEDFSSSLVGSEWSSGSLETSSTNESFLGRFGNETVSLELNDLDDSGQVKVQFDLILIGDWDGAAEDATGPSRWMLDVEGGETLIDTTFSNGMGGQNYPDVYPGPVNPEYSGAVAVGSLGYPRDSIYRITQIFQRNESDLGILRLNFTGSGLEESNAANLGATWGLDNVRVTLLDADNTITLGANEVIDGVDIGNTKPGGVTGTKRRDADGFGEVGPGAAGIAGVTVYADLNGNGLLDDDEPSDVTGDSGSYAITGLAPGDYVIREVEPAGSIQTVPFQPAYLVTIASGQIVRQIDFANAKRGEIHGVKWSDLNGNSELDADEPGLAGVTIYADLNNNGTLDTGEPRTVTMADHPSTALDEAGRYWLVGVPPGNIAVREVVPTGFQQTFPLNGVQFVDVLPGQAVRRVNFGNRPAGSEIHGTKWLDLNGDGKQTSDEPGLGDVVIYSDVNNNGTFDFGEPSTLTMFDNPATPNVDETGMYWLTGLMTDFTILREVVPQGFQQTFPASGFYTALNEPGSVISGLDFGNTPDDVPPVVDFPDFGQIGGLLLQGTAKAVDGRLQLTPAERGDNAGAVWTEQQVAFGNDFTFSTQFSFEISSPSGQSDVDGPGGHGLAFVLQNDPNGPNALGEGGPGLGFFGVSPAMAIEFDTWDSGRFDVAANAGTNGSHVALDFASQPESIAQSAPLPRFNDGGIWNASIQYDGANQQLEVFLSQDLANMGAAVLSVGLNLTGIGDLYAGFTAGTAANQGGVHEIVSWTMSTGAPSPSAGAASGDSAAAYDFGSAPQAAPAALGPVAAGVEDLLAVNDCYGVNPQTGITTIAKPGVLTNDTLTPPVNTVLVMSPSHGTITFNGDGSFVYVADGTFAGTDYFSYEFVDASGQTSNVALVTLTTNQEECISLPVQGEKWNDTNGDGGRGATESGIAGVTIYADLNDNQMPDPGEPTTVTDATGSYSLSVPGGTYVIREVLSAGFVQTFPGNGHLVTVGGGQELPSLNFGNRQQENPNETEIHGLKWEDIDGDGKQGPNEPGLAGVTIYMDLNANGILDPGEPSTVTMTDDPNTPEDETGMYYLTGVPNGSTILVSEVVPSGYSQTFPVANGGSYPLVLEAGAIVTGLDFGNTRVDVPTTQVHGFKWEDLDSDGKQGPDEPGIGGVVIYADLNNNGMLDDGEPSTTTMFNDPDTPEDETGMYWLTGVPAGDDVHIREVVPDGFTQTFPGGDGAYHADLAGTQFPGNFDFGNFQPEFIYDGSDEIYGADGADVIFGDNDLSDPLIVSIGDDDWLYGQEGDDTMNGQDENDTLIGGEGVDTLRGGVDIDRVLQTVDADQTLTNGLLTGQGPDVLMDIEHATLTGGVSGNIIDASLFTLGGVILIGEGGNDTLIATDDDDQLFGGDGDDTLTALDGNDILDGGQGSDALGGDDGDDTYLFGDTSVVETDSISEAAGGGHDTLDFTALPISDVLTLNLTTGVAIHGSRSITLPGAAFIEDVYGGPGVNDITGNALANLIVGQDSDDTLDGAAGEDVIIGAGGDDSLEGGPDSDLFPFEPNWGTDTVTDAGGTDDRFDFSAISDDLFVTIGSVTVVQGGNTVSHAGNDIEHLLGGDGDDQFIFLDGATLALGLGTIDGGPGVNLLDYSAYTTSVTVDLSANSATGTSSVANLSNVTGGSAGDSITGDGGENLLLGLGGADTVSGLGGDDTIRGGEGDDVSLNGGAGSDTIYGGAGNDTMLGGLDDDFFIFETPVGTENDTITEAAGPLGGDDTLDFTSLSALYAINLNLDTGSPALHFFRSMTLTNPAEIEIVLGTPGNDNIVGNAADNRLEGGLGNDTLRGMGGSDTLIGGEGNDTYQLDLNSASDTNLVIEQVGEGTDTLDFSNLTVGGASDFAIVDLSSDSLAEHNADATRTVTTNAGLAINFENVVGSDGNDEITGSDAENRLQGGLGNDLLLGGLGDDTLEGGNDNDTLFGGKNNDIIRGGSGTNELRGGPNNDTYFFTAGATDTIIEDQAEVIDGLAIIGGTDTLDFSAYAGGIVLDLAAANPHLISGSLSLSFEDSDGVLTSDNIEVVKGSLSFANTLGGNAADNTLFGGNLGDTLSGGDGDDFLIGGLGNDQLDGEADDDTILYDASDTTSIDGGADNDTLLLEGGGTNLNLTMATYVVGFETIDMTASGSQTIQVDEASVIANGGASMVIEGTSSDMLVHVDVWNRIVDGATVDTYQHGTNLALTMLVNDDISVSPSPSPAAAASPIVVEAADEVHSRIATGGDLGASPRAVRRLDRIDIRRRSTSDTEPAATTDRSQTLRVLRSRRAAHAIDQVIADLSKLPRRRRPL